MSGKLMLEQGGGWKQSALALLLSAAATIVLAWLVVARIGAADMELSAMALTIVSVLIAYGLFRAFYPTACRLLPREEVLRTVTWTLTEDTLTIGGDVIPRNTIRQVHCWPNRDALGNRYAGWTVNIETTGKNRLLRSITDEKLAEQSACQLRELVAALGCAGRWDSAAGG